MKIFISIIFYLIAAWVLYRIFEMNKIVQVMEKKKSQYSEQPVIKNRSLTMLRTVFVMFLSAGVCTMLYPASNASLNQSAEVSGDSLSKQEMARMTNEETMADDDNSFDKEMIQAQSEEETDISAAKVYSLIGEDSSLTYANSLLDQIDDGLLRGKNAVDVAQIEPSEQSMVNYTVDGQNISVYMIGDEVYVEVYQFYRLEETEEVEAFEK